MKTPHEVLQEVKVAGLRTLEEERKWAELKRQCQSPAVLGLTWFGILLFISLIGALWLYGHPGDWKGLPFVPFATLLLMAPGVIVAYRRRQNALLRIIEIEAPRLFQKLKDEKIA
jgi:hypothetical protein